jgi:GNAT superfamily N-acetyltransferase
VSGPEVRVDDRPLSRRDLAEATDIAGRAFHDGPFFRFVFPSDHQRARSVRIIHHTVFAHPGRDARIRTARDARDRIVGLSLWLPPGRHPLSTTVQLAQLPGSLRAVYRQPRTLSVGLAYARATAPLHPHEPHWYLSILMTDPTAQRTGVGSAMMTEALTRVDADGVGAYLETANESNVPYYEKFGFALRATVQPLPGGPPRYSLWREPVASSD